MRWVEALKEWNSKRGGKYFIPKKDSAEYLEVKALMEVGDPRSLDPSHKKATKPDGVMGPASDRPSRPRSRSPMEKHAARAESPKERHAVRSHDFRAVTSALEHARSYKAAGGAGAGAADPPGGEKWIQEAVAKMKKGAFTAQAARRGKEPMEFAMEVVADPGKYTETTRKRAQFLVNIQKRS